MSTYDKVSKSIKKLFRRPRKVGLALGGGSSRGVAHVGVLKALVDSKIPIDYIAGCSSGAIFGALFAGGMDIDDMAREMKKTDWFRIVRLKFNGLWPISGEGIEEFIKKFAGYDKIEDLIIPFAAVATDYFTGKKVVIKQGNLARVVQASSAIPGILAPVEYDGKLLMDGMMVDNVPADVAREMGADYVIAVDVVPDVILTDKPKNMMQVMERAIDIACRDRFSKELVGHADIIISPVRSNISPFDLTRSEQLIKAGEQATLKVVGRIKKDLGIRS